MKFQVFRNNILLLASPSIAAKVTQTHKGRRGTKLQCIKQDSYLGMHSLSKEKKAAMEKFVFTACIETTMEAIGYLPLGCARDGVKT